MQKIMHAIQIFEGKIKQWKWNTVDLGCLVKKISMT
jgi:hypothetical protein